MKKNVKLLLGIFILILILVASGNKPRNNAKDTVTLTWWQIGTQAANLDKVVAAINEYTKEKINIEIDLKFSDWSVWRDKITTMVNAGESWDIMFTNADFYANHVRQGAYADISELVKTESPDLYAFIPKMLWDGASLDGKIYSVPTYKDSAQTQYWVWDKEIVNKYNIDVKNAITFEQLDPILREIQATEYPNDEGYILQIASNGINGKNMHYIDVGGAGLGIRYDDKTLTIVNIYEEPEVMKDAIIMHKWFKDGLIDPDAAILAETPMTHVPLSSAQAFSGAEVILATQRGIEEVVMVPWSDTVYSTGTILGSVNAISASSPYQAEALKYLELVNLDTKLRDMYSYGLEGENFKYNGDGTVSRLNDIWTAPAYSQATFFTATPLAPNPPNQWDAVKKQMDAGIPSVLLGFAFDPTPVESEIVNCNAVFNRYKKDYNTGSVDPLVIVPKIYEEFEKAGYATIRAEVQRQLDAWAKKQKND